MMGHSIFSLRPRGQVLLIVILIMVVVLTIALSVATRSITNTRLTVEDQDAKRALTAAEAGIEQVLKTNSTVGIGAQSLGNDSSIKQVSLKALSGDEFLLYNGLPVSRDDGADIWFVNHNTNGTPDYSSMRDGSLTIYWGKSADVCSATSNNTMAAMQVIVVTGPVSGPRANRYVFDPCNVAPNRQGSTSFTLPTKTIQTVDGVSFAYNTGTTLNGLSNVLFIRVIPYYADVIIGVTASIALPQQGTYVDAVGAAGDAERRVSTFKGYPKLPTEFFPYGIFIPKS